MKNFSRIFLFIIIFSLLISSSVYAQEDERAKLDAENSAASLASLSFAAISSPDDLAIAMGVPAERIISSSLGISDENGVAVLSTAQANFPTGDDSDFAALASGGNQNGSGSGLGGLNTSVGTDMVQYTLMIDTNNVVSWSLDYKFLSDEYFNFVGDIFNDAFILETETSTFTLTPPIVNAADSLVLSTVNSIFADYLLDPLGTGPIFAGNAAATIYNGASDILSVGADVPANTSTTTLIFSVMDLGDSILDTAVFLDNFQIVEIENEQPDCSLATPSLDTLWPPNHKLHDITVLGVTDPDGDPITLTIDSIFQDEATDERGSGNTAPDGFGVGTDTASLRAERSGKLNGRVYHIGFIALDGQGASCSGSVTVSVPHDRGKKGAAVDEGALLDSTQ